ncbi:acyl-homoserine-lactone synthase TraI [Shinella curvata]|uniref:Acyl-homoserine-lactone synthase n=1 Tax=Shinella curvata TaxID=1817964 RepID=A0ABT8XLN8_9HYPH|nr:acyl-homoserine-lactone synthase TraI [Shinella curvata]MCJ8057038.1 acyl-homoserine-lactone synthase TraI [Shinella curvata]MDO6124642.1 acyl-homoserine-lactone synthase TraI [Shinella curvata]
MRLAAISIPKTPRERQLLWKQHKLRAEVFSDRLGWEVIVRDGIEIDRFDALGPTYVLAVLDNDRVAGCARLLPSNGPTMVQDIFPSLIPGGQLHSHAGLIESSRFCVDTQCEGRGQTAIHEITLSMLAGIIEWSIANGYSEIVTVTDLRFERILSRVGWPLHRLAPPQKIGVTTAVAGTLLADQAAFERLRPERYRSLITSPFGQAA